MYSIPPIYGKEPFNVDFPLSMYKISPYYSDISMDEDLPKSLPIPSDVDLNDPDCRTALEDLLSRQMLLLCRLNNLERDLLESNNIEVKTSYSFPKIKNLTQKYEDIVVHFNINRPPLTLFSVLNLLSKEFSGILINYHVHSTLLNDQMLPIKQKSLDTKLPSINSKFNNQDNTDRGNCQLIITFIAKKLEKECYGFFQSNKPEIVGELNILQKICSMVYEMDNKTQELWKLLMESDLTSDKICIEKLGQYLIGLRENQFIFNEKEPKILDVIVWSLANISEDKSRALKSLIDPKWSQVIESLLIKN